MNNEPMSTSELIDAYWDCAYREGAEGRTHDTRNGDAQRIRSQIDLASTNLPESSSKLVGDDKGGEATKRYTYIPLDGLVRDAKDAARYRWLLSNEVVVEAESWVWDQADSDHITLSDRIDAALSVQRGEAK